MVGVAENLVLKKLNVLTFLFAVANFGDEYLNICGVRVFKEGGEVYALQKGDESVAFVILGKPPKFHIFQIFTPPGLRRRGYAGAIIRELQKIVGCMECFIDEEKDACCREPLSQLLLQSGFVTKEGVYKFLVGTDEIRRWTNTFFWQKYRNYLQRFRQKGWKAITFAGATMEQQDYVKNSYHNEFQGGMDPQKIFAKDGGVDTGLSFILLRNNEPVAFTLMRHPGERAYTLELASTAGKYLGRGGIFILYCETAMRLAQKQYRGCFVKFHIRETNVTSLATAEHFCEQLNLTRHRFSHYEWEC